jgi:serralysin
MAKKKSGALIFDSGIEGPVNGEISDASTYNLTTLDPGFGSGLPDLATPGETIRGKTVYDYIGDWDSTRPGDNNVLTQLDGGPELDVTDGVITFAFLNQQHVTGINNNPQLGEGKGYSPFNAAQKVAAREAVNNWDELIAPEFKEITPAKGAKTWAQSGADIWLANTTTGPAQAWAYYPGSGNQYSRISSDVWIADPRVNPTNGQLDPGFYGLQTLNHELGHAIGLSHPGDYNFGDDNDGDGQPDPITYEGDAFYYQDNNQYSIMSYFDSYEAGNNQIDWNLMRFIYPSTPMVDDIRVAQEKYGVETSTRTGDTVYGFNASADVTNAAMRFEAGDTLSIFTIWDAGGNDTLDLSGYRTGSIIDLREGAYSSAGGFGAYDASFAGVDPSTISRDDYLAFINQNNVDLGFGPRSGDPVTDPDPYRLYDLYFLGRAGSNEGVAWFDIMGRDTLMENNIGIAYGAVIENAIGGAGADQINGNQANNVFTGNGGADTFVIARYGLDDDSVDTITDFQTGLDKIDLAAFAGLSAANVSFDDPTDTLSVDTDKNGSFDMTVIVHGTVVGANDFVWA